MLRCAAHEQIVSEVWILFSDGGTMSPVSLLYLLVTFPIENIFVLY